MLRTLAIIIGLCFILFGMMGLSETYNTNGYLFDTFRVNFEHNITHLVTGILLLLCGIASGFASKLLFITLGLIYGALAVFGYFAGDGLLFQLLAINMADNILHAIAAVFFLLIGLVFKY